MHMVRQMGLLPFLGWPPRAPGALEAVQNRRLARLLHHAWSRCPAYRDALGQAGWTPGASWSVGDLSRLPVLDKARVRERLGELMDRGLVPERCLQRITSGTTGTPVRFPMTRLEELIELRLWTQVYATAGLRPRHRQARFAFAHAMPTRVRLPQRFGFYRRRYFPMDEPPLPKLQWLDATRPDALFAWASVLDEMSLYLESAGRCLPIPLIVSTSTLLHPAVRRRCEERFQARVLDAYGSVEAGPIAWDCPEGGYHVRHDTTIVELLDADGRAGMRGRVVCTPLWRRALPLLRIDLGDLAEWEDAPCRCGVPGRRFRFLFGRAMDLIRIGAHGEWIAPFRLASPMFWLPGIRQYQVVQEADDRFTLYVVAGPEFTPAAEQQAADYFAREFAGRLAVRIVRVPAIHIAPGSKPLMVVTLARQEEMRRGGKPFVAPVQGGGDMAGDTGRTLEKSYIDIWSKAHPPLRPAPAELAFYERWLQRSLAAGRRRVLILGSTAELRDLAIRNGVRATCCDMSEATWTAMRALMKEQGPEDFLCSNWLDIPEDRAWDVILGDGSIPMLPMKAIEPLVAKVSRLAGHDGTLVFRIGVHYPGTPLTAIRDAVADYHRQPGDRTLNEHVLYMVNMLRSEHALEMPPRDFFETKIAGLLDPADAAVLRDQLFYWRVELPPKAWLDAVFARHTRLLESRQNDGPGNWDGAFLYVLQPLGAGS